MSAPPRPLDLATPGRYHVVGVGGPGMSAIALVLAEMGHEVSGSDLRESPVLDRLRAAGVDVHVGHAAAHVDGVDAVTASTAIPAANLELATARERASRCCGGPACSRRSARCARSVAVAGTHGKTTTTSMLAMILVEAGLQPSFIVGGDVNDVGTGAHWTGGEWLVVEADESDGTFLELPLGGTVVTNVEADHLDHYGTFDAIVAGLRPLPRPGRRARRCVCVDDPVAARLGRAPRRRHLRHRPRRRLPRSSTSAAERGALRVHGRPRRRARSAGALPLRGLHNVRNATGCHRHGRRRSARRSRRPCAALARFGGVARRFDVPRRADGSPSSTTTPTSRPRSPPCSTPRPRAATAGARVVAVFQPNRYSRMAVLSPDVPATPSSTPTSPSHRHLPVGRGAACPGSPASSWSTPC